MASSIFIYELEVSQYVLTLKYRLNIQSAQNTQLRGYGTEKGRPRKLGLLYECSNSALNSFERALLNKVSPSLARSEHFPSTSALQF